MAKELLPNYAVPYRPAISDVLVRASANVDFRSKLLYAPLELLHGMDIPMEDAEMLVNIYAQSLNDFARQLKNRLSNTG